MMLFLCVCPQVSFARVCVRLLDLLEQCDKR